MNNFFENNDTKTALEAQYEAQRIAFAPIIFQVAKSMRDLGLLEALFENEKSGLSVEELATIVKLSNYGVQTLLETSLSADIVKLKDEKYFITKTGYFLLKDEMTRVNMNYNHYVNYQGLYYLDEAIKKEEASGLKVFGEWSTIYPALSTLPSKASKSWFEFDHFYSDSAFSQAIDLIIDAKPTKVLDIGGNTGKFSIALAKKESSVKVTIADLAEQVKLAYGNIKEANLENRVDFKALDILKDETSVPEGYDIIWMSQFLDCFKAEDIVKILKKVKKSMSKNSRIYIMEPLWDKQRFETAAYCIINTSPYFTAMANGYSKMFNSKDMLTYIKEAGLKVEKQLDSVGLCQSVLICK
ncbi:MAG: methyltransferase domain-containing protein [Helicobacteraceae bacterium]|nr:methyltransferase domain-containing protein [Helicobacteraceae bacterium]